MPKVGWPKEHTAISQHTFNSVILQISFRGFDLTHPCRSPPHPPIVIVLITVYSSVPYLLPSLPNPLCFTPPKGVAGSLINPVLTPTIPTSSASATLHIRPMSRLKKYPANPTSASLASSMTSFSVLNWNKPATGPHVSSDASCISCVIPVITVG